MKTPDINKIERTINSLEGIKRAEVNPFLMTRILEKMKAPLTHRIQPVVARNWVMSVLLIAIINIGVFLYLNSQAKQVSTSEDLTYMTTQLYSY